MSIRRFGLRLSRMWTRLPEGRAQAGQALVELALSITFIFLLFASAVDLGLAYKSYQTLVNGVAEASTYLDLYPSVNCGTSSCNPFAAANAEALRRFRGEQGTNMGHFASTRDLNSNGKDDFTESGGEQMVSAMFQVQEADSTQIDANPNGRFALRGNFDPNATDAECRMRSVMPIGRNNPLVTSCYVVVRAEILYRPFILRPIIGDWMIIRTISVRRVVTG